MKQLKVKWVPETSAIVAMTMVRTSPTRTAILAAPSPILVNGAGRTKFIVISGETELRADVTTAR